MKMLSKHEHYREEVTVHNQWADPETWDREAKEYEICMDAFGDPLSKL